MKLLVLGGSAWLGREVARQAVGRGHDVTCVTRGLSGSIPDGASHVQSDRDDGHGLEAVAAVHWDAVLDVSRQPGQVKRAVRDLRSADYYLFVSSVSVYADHGPLGQDEDAPLLPPLESEVMETMETYGEAKAACEKAVLEGLGADRCMIARVGLIGGPGDIFGRTGYWPMRFSSPSVDDGTVLVPNAPSLPVQVIDVRDLAAWLVQNCEGQLSGVYNATGDRHSFAEHIAAAREVAGHHGLLATADAEWLHRHGVGEWAGPKSLPLWLSDPEWQGMNARSNVRAKDAGLVLRPLAQTLRDTLEWEESSGIEKPRRAGLTRVEEAELITELG